MGLVGAPWIITCDPTDLVALPALALGMHVFGRAMRRESVANLRRSGELAFATVGLLCCVATSTGPDQGDDPDLVLPEIEADVYVHNGTDQDLVVRIRALDPDALVDCQTVATDPGRLLSVPLFGVAESWTVPPDGNVTVRELFGSRSCEAALVDADGWPTRLVFWHSADVGWTTVSGAGIDPDAPGWIDMTFEDGAGAFASGLEILFELDEGTGADEGVCQVQDDGDRNDWSAEVPYGSWSLVAIDDGPDGCTGLGLAALGTEDEVVRWYVCTPELDLPFVEGDAIDIAWRNDSDDGVTVRALGPDALESSVPARELVVTRGSEPARVADLDATFVPKFDCPYTVDDCGTVAQAGFVAVGGPGWPSAEIAAGERIVLERADGAVVRFAVAHAEERRVVDPECALGPDDFGADVEVAATYVGAPQ